jgi:hypothetical protein
MRGKIFALCMFLCIATGCTELKYHDLYCITDKAVESLYTEYESYGIFGGREEYTPQKDYKVMPIGRLINIRIEHVATTEEYESLLQALKSHYKGDSRVFDVYRCNAGTVMIDCRR